MILYNVYRDHSTPVAKATILSTDRKKIVGGHELGTECCEVVVDYIIKRNAILLGPIGNVTTMGQAQGRTIGWLYKHVGFFFFASDIASSHWECDDHGTSSRKNYRLAL